MGGEPSNPAEAQNEDLGSVEGGGELLQGQLYSPLGGGEGRCEKTDTVQGLKALQYILKNEPM